MERYDLLGGAHRVDDPDDPPGLGGGGSAAGSIADGAHSLETQITTPDLGVEILDVTFTLAPDACG